MSLLLQPMSCTRVYGLWSSRYGLPQRKLGLQRTVLRIIRRSGVAPLEVGGRGLDHIGYTLRKIPWVRCPGAGLDTVRAGWYKPALCSWSLPSAGSPVPVTCSTGRAVCHGGLLPAGPQLRLKRWTYAIFAFQPLTPETKSTSFLHEVASLKDFVLAMQSQGQH